MIMVPYTSLGHKMRVNPEPLKADLIFPWIIQGILLSTLFIFVGTCFIYGDQIKQTLPEDQRLVIRSIFYVIAIVTFPMTNLIRHIQLRLNQTMPFSGLPARSMAKNRYLITIFVSMSLIESIGIFGFIMYIIGDTTNSLFIFTGLAALGMFLYRPKLNEYTRIVEALTNET